MTIMDLGFLGAALRRPGPWASVWADASSAPRDPERARELTARGVRERLSTLGADRITREAVYETLAIAPRAGTTNRRGGRYVLASEGVVVCDLPLTAPPARSGEAWSALPRLTPLLDGLPDDTPCLVARVDRTGADLELRTGRPRPLAAVPAAGPAAGIPAGPATGTAARGRRHGRDERGRGWEERRHDLPAAGDWPAGAPEIAREISDAWNDSGAEVLLLAGEPGERHAVREHLPAAVVEHTAETDHGGRDSGAAPGLLERDVAAARAAHERERAVHDVERYHADDADAASDLPALLEAAREHRIDTLLVHPRGGGLAHEVWVGSDPDQLAVRSADVTALGASEVRPARADDALLWCVAATGARVVAVTDPAQAPPGGLGAVLLPPENPPAA